jgi:DNA-binding NtrC family response regulator
MAKVLLVGYIREFLEERRNVLHAAGYQVVTALTLEAAHQAIHQETFDVAVLGYSVPREERNQFAAKLKEASPDVKIIMIYFASTQNTELADALVPTTASAQEVLRAVDHLLSNPGDSKTG